MYYHEEDITGNAEQYTGFSSSHSVIGAMLGWNFLTLLLTLSLTSYQAATTKSLPTIRRSDTHLVPDLKLGETFTYHLFLSHIWSSGQDQMATVKRQLQLLLPNIKVAPHLVCSCPASLGLVPSHPLVHFWTLATPLAALPPTLPPPTRLLHTHPGLP